MQSSPQSLNAEVHGFREIDKERQVGETLKEAVKRLKKRIKITFNQSTYNAALERLKEYNFNLKNIRKHAEQLKSPDLRVKDTTSNAILLPPQAGALRRARLAAHSFYQAMSTYCVCEEKAHQHHMVRLFMNTELKDEIRMNFLLQVDSESSLKESTSASATEERIHCGKMSDDHHPNVFSLEVRSFILDYSACPTTLNESRVTKRQRVKCADRDVSEEVDTSSDQILKLASSKVNVRNYIMNLQPTSDAIRLRKVGCKAIADSFQSGACLGYLDVQVQKNPYRHSFYRWPGQLLTNTLSTPRSLTELFHHPIHKFYDIRDQLELAKTMVSVVLKFHSTPWLDQWWTLKDMCYLNASNEMTDVLNTIHFGAVLGYSSQLDSSGDRQKEQPLRQDIKNANLYNLGVALLQIDRWKDIDSNAAVDIDKLAAWSRFGPKYRLHCNFGVDYDLAKPKLQSAAVEKVIGELDSMLAGLMIDDDEDEDEDGG
ncbi:hypothetical protein F4818DRAFT_455250 [Hypoxylon cercidicola]|nr:hypothetical protein F4818DRAFT_455250 [Hypoxylon cercidicola]